MAGMAHSRIAWIDHAKGICIVLVVMLYAVDLIERTAGREGWLHAVVRFAAPFRMPDFFLVSGLLLSRVIGRDWRTYLERKVVHFAYFYLLWLTILVAFESPWIAAKAGWPGVAALYLRSLVTPYSMLWFIYLLPVFFVVTKLAQRMPAAVMWTLAAALQVAQLETGVKVIDKFAAYYVFFYSGYVLAPQVFRFAEAVSSHRGKALLALGAWGVLDGTLAFAGHASLPGISLALAFLGAAAAIALAASISGMRVFAPLRYCGEHSIVIYLAFLVPMVVTRKVLVTTRLVEDVGSMSLVATIAAIAGALALYWLVRGTRLRFLFERPERISLERLSHSPTFATANTSPTPVARYSTVVERRDP